MRHGGMSRNREQMILMRPCYYALILSAIVALPAAASEWLTVKFPIGPMVILSQPNECTPGACVRSYEHVFLMTDVLPSESVQAPYALHVSSTLAVSSALRVGFSPFALCCELEGRYRVTLSAATLPGIEPELRVAIASYHNYLTDLPGPGTATFAAEAGVSYYAVVYGAGSEDIDYELTIAAVPDSRLTRTLERVGRTNLNMVLAAVPEVPVSVQMVAGLLVLSIAVRTRVRSRLRRFVE